MVFDFAVTTNEPIKKLAFFTFYLNILGLNSFPSFSVTVKVLEFKSISTLTTSGTVFSCLFIAFEHIY